MIADDSYSGSIVSILNISCDVSRYSIHDYCLSGDVSRYDIHELRSILICISRYCIALCVFPFFLRSVFLLLHARFLGVVWSFEHTCLSHCFISRFTVESVQCRNESNGRHPVSRVVQRILGKYAALSVGVDQVGTWLFSLLSTRLETWNSRGMYMDLSRGMKVNEFADLTTSEFVSEYTRGETQHCVEWSEALGSS